MDAELRALVTDDHDADEMMEFYAAVQEAEYAEKQIAEMDMAPSHEMEIWIYSY